MTVVDVSSGSNCSREGKRATENYTTGKTNELEAGVKSFISRTMVGASMEPCETALFKESA